MPAGGGVYSSPSVSLPSSPVSPVSDELPPSPPSSVPAPSLDTLSGLQPGASSRSAIKPLDNLVKFTKDPLDGRTIDPLLNLAPGRPGHATGKSGSCVV